MRPCVQTFGADSACGMPKNSASWGTVGKMLNVEVCRNMFEPFGSLKSAVLAARDNEPGDTRLKPSGFNGDQMTSDPEYEAPLVKELELVLVVFDILYMGAQVGATAIQ